MLVWGEVSKQLSGNTEPNSVKCDLIMLTNLQQVLDVLHYPHYLTICNGSGH